MGAKLRTNSMQITRQKACVINDPKLTKFTPVSLVHNLPREKARGIQILAMTEHFVRCAPRKNLDSVGIYLDYVDTPDFIRKWIGGPHSWRCSSYSIFGTGKHFRPWPFSLPCSLIIGWNTRGTPIISLKKCVPNISSENWTETSSSDNMTASHSFLKVYLQTWTANQRKGESTGFSMWTCF